MFFYQRMNFEAATIVRYEEIAFFSQDIHRIPAFPVFIEELLLYIYHNHIIIKTEYWQ